MNADLAESCQLLAINQCETVFISVLFYYVMYTLPILGVRVDDVDYAEALARIARYVENHRPGEKTRQVVTVNPEIIIAAQRDEEFKRVLNEAALSLPDGVGVLWAARYLGHPLRERVTGVDTMERLAALAARRGWRLFLLGAAPGVAAGAAARLEEKNPGLIVAGSYAGSPAPAAEEEILARIGAAQAQILFVAYGAPWQDKWIYRLRARLGVAVAMGVGGAFDFIAGAAPRAPRWLQNLGLEWLHRLSHQPWRWRRMLALPQFVWLVWRAGRG